MGKSTQQDPVRHEWLFTGRRVVLERILAWIHTEAPGALIVTGSPGCGKSAVVGRIVALSEPARRRALLKQAPLEPADTDPGVGAIDAAVQLRGMGAHDVATVLAARLQLPAPENCWQLIDAVAKLSYPPVLVFDGLDEAVPEQATKIVTDLLVPLSVLASVLVATRFTEFGWNQPPSGQEGAVRLVELFGGSRYASVVDLDDEPDTRQDIERYVARGLRYAGRAELVARVAPVLASRATAQQGGFLYARTVLSQIAREVIDAQVDGWEEQLAATTAGALEHDLSSRTRVRDGVEFPDTARDLLHALAWGMGRGMPGRGVWVAAATALSPTGVHYRATDRDWVLRHYGCYLTRDEQDGEVVYRLAHREFVEYFLASSPDVGGAAAGQALAEGLVGLAHKRTRRGGSTQCSPYLLRQLPRHAAHAGPAGVAALRRLAEADPGSYLPGLAAALGSLTVRYAQLGQHEPALAPAHEVVDIYRRLTGTAPEVYFTHLVTSLKNLTCHLAALDRISAAVDVYTSCVETFATSPACRDALIIERAGFHINHGDVPTGLRELVTLLTLDDGQTPDAVVLTARNVLRANRVRDRATVNRVWRTVAGTEPPDWLALTAAQIDLVTTWITAPGWAESREFGTAHAGELLDHPATVVLDELALVSRPRVELHRHLLNGIREHGIEAAYRPLLLRDLLLDWIKLTDWPDSRSFAEEHAADLLTVEAEVALIHLGDPLGTLVHLMLLRLARRDGIGSAYACVTDRRRAAERMQRALVEVEPDPIAELAALEAHVFGERFTAAAHLAVATSLMGLMGEGLADFTKLEELAGQATPADRQRVAAEIAELTSRVPDRAGFLAALPEILLPPS